ncbi:hypothetical protein [Cellulomonas bogoriensis]|uniref:Uncharacterized protein n=1 Tax=Cellulomonas bogoriensis 69B4 = DSM 16987 TaxID=1386082 RepID=A0A0A0C0E8_9CELL|nr:hypothetical protein [Cellulomonas bogoriensis]KGM14128.1 hypothetical protein N869_03950 [Cellulomonas bogoriensis 69B4 = DSM 16987]
MALGFAAVVAFQVFVTADEVQPVGTQGSFTVVELESATKDDAIGVIDETAKSLGVNIFKVQPDSYGLPQERTLFAFVGDREGFEANGGYDYPSFSSRAMVTHVAPAGDITFQDLRGRYVTSAPAAQVEQVVTRLEQGGVLATSTSLGPGVVVLHGAAEGNLFGPSVVLMLALGLAVAYSVSRRRKVYALRALHGYRRVASVRAEVWSCTVLFGVGLAVLTVVGVPFLWAHNGFNQLSGFLPVLAVTVLGLYLFTVVVVLVAVRAASRGSIPTILKGERASVREGVLAATAQVTVLAIVMATTSAAMTRIESVAATMDEYSRWSEGDPLYALRLSVSGTREDDVRDAPGLSAVIAELEQAGQVLMAHPGDAFSGDPDAEVGPEGARSMIVNHAYVEREPIEDPDGRPVRDLPTGEDHFSLLVPMSYDGDVEPLLQQYVSFFSGFACTDDTEGGRASCDPVGSVVRTKAGQDLFTYNGTAPLPAQMQPPMFVHDPVLVVVSADSGLISPLLYLSYTSGNDVLFTDPDVLDSRLQEHGIRGSFQGIDDASDAVSDSVAFSRRQLRMDAFSLALGWAVLALAAVVMVAVYCDRRRRPMFVQLIHGYTFAGRHWPYLAGAAALSLLGVGIAGAAGGSLAHGRDVAAAAAFVTIQVVISLVAISIYEARFRADVIKRN